MNQDQKSSQRTDKRCCSRGPEEDGKGMQTYILFRLRQLQSVDTVDITDEAKQAAKAMYTRKRVYYNMCIKSLQQTRNISTNPSLKADARRIKCLQK